VNARSKILILPLLIIGAFAMPNVLVSAESDAVITALAPPAPTNAVPETDPQLLRNFLVMQEQLRATQRAVEQARDEAQAESKRTAEIMAARLNLIEQTLNAQREQELDSLRRSTRTMLTVVGLITAAGFVAVLFAGFVQVRAMTRLAEVSEQLRLAFAAPRVGELTVGSSATGHDQIEFANANLLGTIDRLQKRLEEMESKVPDTHTATNGHKQAAVPAASAQAMTIIGKGQALLNLDKPELALEHFEEALNIDPQNVEAWIKKGAALERLQRIDDAIAAYDHAIATDSSTATAYLFKAGVYNRQKKYAEALQCYEKALSVQQKSRAAQTAPV
jgi:tetratricopeptide (TPR) repeat protein